MKQEWQAFWLALGFLSRIPMLVKIDYSQQLMNQSSVYFPLVGLLLGGLYAGVYILLVSLWPPLVALLLVLCLHLWLTGAFHEDGLADSADGLGGGYTVEKRLLIMKDSRIGTYGTAALGCALALKVALWLALPPETVWLALLICPAIARLTPLFFMAFMPYVSDPDTSKSKPVAESFSRARLLMATLFVVGVALVAGVWWWATTAVVVVLLGWGWTLRRSLGGYTGDTLGASVVLTELVLLLGMAV